MGKRGPKPQNKISTAWSSNLAYAVGLIATDGCLSKDGRHVDFTSKDKCLVLVFKDCLSLGNIKIGKKKAGNNNQKDYFRIQFGSVLFYNWLLGLGLTPAKSKILGSLKIPDKYFFDFLRGCFDGDGSIYSYWDPRWRSSYMFYISFASASLLFLLWIKKKIAKIADVHGKITPAARSLQLRFAKSGSVVLFKRMFYSGNVPHLKRKFAKAQKIFRINKRHNARVV